MLHDEQRAALHCIVEGQAGMSVMPASCITEASDNWLLLDCSARFAIACQGNLRSALLCQTHCIYKSITVLQQPILSNRSCVPTQGSTCLLIAPPCHHGLVAPGGGQNSAQVVLAAGNAVLRQLEGLQHLARGQVAAQLLHHQRVQKFAVAALPVGHHQQRCACARVRPRKQPAASHEGTLRVRTLAWQGHLLEQAWHRALHAASCTICHILSNTQSQGRASSMHQMHFVFSYMRMDGCALHPL